MSLKNLFQLGSHPGGLCNIQTLRRFAASHGNRIALGEIWRWRNVRA
ncbi:hypothetical protein [Ideonella sp.]